MRPASRMPVIHVHAAPQRHQKSARGIGRATAEAFARGGALVAIFARSAEKLNEIAKQHADRMIAVSGDVADSASIDRLFSETEKRFGDCEILVNNAGMIDPKPLVDVTPDAWDRMFAVNVRGTYLASRRGLQKMLAKRSGAIVNVASIS